MDMPSIFEVFQRRRWRQIGRAGSFDFFTGLLVSDLNELRAYLWLDSHPRVS